MSLGAIGLKDKKSNYIIYWNDLKRPIKSVTFNLDITIWYNLCISMIAAISEIRNWWGGHTDPQ